jgi:hypothetical protein
MRPKFSIEPFRRYRRVAGLVMVGLLCRALIPVGFMPAAIADGGPVVICHGGLAGEFFRELAAHRDDGAGHGGQQGPGGHAGHAMRAAADLHAGPGSVSDAGHGDDPRSVSAPGDDDASGGAHEAWHHCPIGAFFGAAAIGAAFELSLPVLEDRLDAIEPAAPLLQPFVSSHRARGPPASPLLS